MVLVSKGIAPPPPPATRIYNKHEVVRHRGMICRLCRYVVSILLAKPKLLSVAAKIYRYMNVTESNHHQHANLPFDNVLKAPLLPSQPAAHANPSRGPFSHCGSLTRNPWGLLPRVGARERMHTLGCWGQRLPGAGRSSASMGAQLGTHGSSGTSQFWMRRPCSHIHPQDMSLRAQVRGLRPGPLGVR